MNGSVGSVWSYYISKLAGRALLRLRLRLLFEGCGAVGELQQLEIAPIIAVHVRKGCDRKAKRARIALKGMQGALGGRSACSGHTSSTSTRHPAPAPPPWHSNQQRKHG